MSFQILPKISIVDKFALSLAYTPGVGSCSALISQNKDEVSNLTNKSNSIAVIHSASEPNLNTAIERCKFLHDNLGADAYPILIQSEDAEKISMVINNLEPTFAFFDLSLVNEKQFTLNSDIKILDDKNFIKQNYNQSLNIDDFKANTSSISENSIELHTQLKGVIKTAFNDNKATPQLVGVISDGSAVLGLGNIGGNAGLPVMEGKAALFKELAGIDAMPICLKTQDENELIEIISLISPTFSGINLEDISAPRCFSIENTLKQKLNIPVFHDDQHGTAVVVLASIINALKLVNKDKETIKVVLNGPGAAGLAVLSLLLKYGVKNILMVDRDGIVYPEKTAFMDEYKAHFAKITNPTSIKGDLATALLGADVFIGVSAPNILTKELISIMNEKPIVFALANPTPEIMPDVAKEAGVFIIATGRSDFPNQVNNSLVFPGIFRGALDSGATQITDEMKIIAAKAVAELVGDRLSTEFIIPDALDRNVPIAVADAVKK